MKLTVQVMVHADDGTEAVAREVFTMRREEPLALDTLGLQLAEGCSQGKPKTRHELILS